MLKVYPYSILTGQTMSYTVIMLIGILTFSITHTNNNIFLISGFWTGNVGYRAC